MYSLQGLVGWLNDPRTKPANGVVFVGRESVRALLNYQSTDPDEARLVLEDSQEFIALGQLRDGIHQSELWDLLMTTLADCIDPELALMVSSINIRRDSTQGLQIAEAGRNAANQAGWRLAFQGDDGATQTITLKKDWIYKGRIFDCMETIYEIPIRLMIDGDARPLPVFTFHAAQLDAILRRARADVVAALRQGVAIPYNGTDDEPKDEPLRWSIIDGAYTSEE